MSEKKVKVTVYESFWFYCVIVSWIVFASSLTGFLILLGLVLVLNLTLRLLNVIGSVLGIVIVISFFIAVSIMVIKECRERR